MLVPQYDEKSFRSDIIGRWGHLSDELVEDAPLLHVQTAHLGRLCVEHPEVAVDILRFLEETVSRKDAISEIENAIAISFLDWSEIHYLGLTKVLPSSVSRIIKEQRNRYKEQNKQWKRYKNDA